MMKIISKKTKIFADDAKIYGVDQKALQRDLNSILCVVIEETSLKTYKLKKFDISTVVKLVCV